MRKVSKTLRSVVIRLGDRVKFLKLMTKLGNRPLLGITDSSLFSPTPAWRQLNRAVERGFNVLLYGQRGSGRTTLLRMLAQSDDLPHPVVFVDGSRASTAVQALAVVIEAIEAPMTQPFSMSALVEGLRPPPTRAAYSPDAELLRLVEALGRVEPRVILLDEAPGAEEAHRLFGRLRDALWQTGHQWVVATTVSTARDLSRPPADAFFEVRLAIEELNDDDQLELLRRRVTEQELQEIAPMVVQAPATPRQAISLARQALLDDGDPLRFRRAREEREEALGRLTAPQRAVVEHLHRLGEASPSDVDLQQAVGVSPTTLRTIFDRLQLGGIVQRHDDRARGQGRPRATFSLNEEYRS